MAKKLKPKPDDKEQSRRFVETARSIGADEGGKAFERVLDVVIVPNPKTVRLRKQR